MAGRKDAPNPEAGTLKPVIPYSQLPKEEQKKLVRVFAGDEWSHTVGVLNVFISGFLCARWPQNYWIVHLVKASILLPWRFVRFRRTNSELYMLDFCYFATYAATICCFLTFVRVTFGYVSPLHAYNAVILKAGFVYTGGALAWAIVLFRNSLVFHDIDLTTSVFIHLSPAVMMWCLRWGAGMGPSVVEEAWPDMFYICPGVDLRDVDRCVQEPFHWCTECPASFNELVLYPLIIYLLAWAIPYYIVIFCCCNSWIERQQKETLFSLIMKDPVQSKFVRLFPEKLQPLGYIIQHMIVVIVFGFGSIIFWYSFWAHTICLLLVIAKAVHNGSTYVFRVFATRYVDEQVMRTAPVSRTPSQGALLEDPNPTVEVE